MKVEQLNGKTYEEVKAQADELLKEHQVQEMKFFKVDSGYVAFVVYV